MKSVTTHEAKTHLSKLLTEVEQGEEIVILRGTVPAARLVKVDSEVQSSPRRPPVGTVTSQGVRFTDETFAPLSEGELESWGL